MLLLTLGVFGWLLFRAGPPIYRHARNVLMTGTAIGLACFALFPAMKKFWQALAGNLSGGQKQMLAISRAIVEPRKLLLVDEPTKGLAPAIIQAMIEAFRELKRDTTLLVVEQNFHFARSLGDAVAVMDSGRIVHRGRMADLAADEALQQRLLGLSLDTHQ